MAKAEIAQACFKEGFSCSQAVLKAFSGEFGLDPLLALKISQPFGGGIARMGETCGAVSGAFLVIGLKYGRTKAEDSESRDKTYALVREFLRRFASSCGSTQCKTLLGYDISTDEGLKLAHDKGLVDARCPVFIRTAVEILEEIL
jgi:C_GCAxxG_C_C family probable redox protein